MTSFDGGAEWIGDLTDEFLSLYDSHDEHDDEDDDEDEQDTGDDANGQVQHVRALMNGRWSG